MWGRNKKEDQDNTQPENEGQNVQNSLVQEDVSDVLAKQAVTARTNVLQKSEELKELRLAVKMTDADNSWRVVQYNVTDLDDSADKELDITIVKNQIEFDEAMRLLADFECQVHKKRRTNVLKDVWTVVEPTQEDFPKECVELEHYIPVCERAGRAFDELGRPYPTRYGQLVEPRRYLKSDVDRAAEFAENAKSICANVEDGVLKDSLETAQNIGNLDDMLNKYQALAYMKDFATCLGDFVHDMEEDKGGVTYNFSKDFSTIKDAAQSFLDQAKSAGVHTEPFEKFLMQVELSLILADAQRQVKGIQDISISDQGLRIAAIKESVADAEQAFRKAGAGKKEIDVLRAAVMTGEKPKTLEFMKSFLNRWNKRLEETQGKLKKQAHRVNVASVPQKTMKP